MSSLQPYSLFNIVKETIFANYQNKKILEIDSMLFFSLVFYLLILSYSKKYGDINRLVLFIIIYHSFEVYKGWVENSYFQLIYLFISLLFLFNFSFNRFKITSQYSKNWVKYLLVFIIVLLGTPPFTSGWAASEWFKVARGYFGLFIGRDNNSAFMTPNSPRTFLYDFFTGGVIRLFDVELGYFIIKIISIALVAFAIYKLLISLQMSLAQCLLVLSIFVLNQDLIGGNGIIGIFEEDRFATSFSILAISYWFQNNFRNFSIFTLLSIFVHIQIGLFWFAFVSIFEILRKNKEYFKNALIILFLSLPVVLPTAYEFLFGKNEIVYAFNKTSSWVYAFIFQAYHVAPFQVDGIIFNDFLLRNWARGFTNILIFSFICLYLSKLTNNIKLKYFLYFFVAYFPLSIFLHYLDSKLSNPGQLASLFLFRFDTVFYLVILCICALTFQNKLDTYFTFIFYFIIIFGLFNVYVVKTNNYNSIDTQVQKTEQVLMQLEPEFILIEPNVELYTGGIELRTGIPTYVSQKYITNSLSNFPTWYEKLELRGRFFQNECNLFTNNNLEYFIGRENNEIKCGDLLFANGDYSIFKVPNIKGFNLPAFNSSCQFTKEDGENALKQEMLNNKLTFEISIIFEDSPLDCSGKVIGSNLEQGFFVDEQVNEIVLVVDK